MLQIKNTLGGGGGNPEGSYVWKKYEYTIDPYLCFLGNEDFTLKTYNATKNWNGTLEYSTDSTTWNTWDGTEISSSGNILYLRGTGNTKICGNSVMYRFVFMGTDTLRISCEGNIENLLDYSTVNAGNHPTMANYCYNAMFKGCTNLTTVPELPATTLAEGCYCEMFSGCTNLTTLPSILPAPILAANCYKDMFKGCTNLTTVPELPATTLAEGCYCEMFSGCTILTTAPVLPATILAGYCYLQMFYGCTNLTTVPELPATTLAGYCYQYMFDNCTNIKLSSTQIGEYQTAYRIPTSGTGTEGSNSLSNMFSSTGGTFTGTPEINTTYYLSTSNVIV